MSLTFTYHSPTTPGNPGFSIDLGQAAVRLGDIPGLQIEAELGSVATSALRFDDPAGTAGHAGDAIIGLKQLSVTESAAPVGNRRIAEYYIGDRKYYRGVGGNSPSLRTDAARVIDMTLVDINSFLSFRILHGSNTSLAGSNTGFNRPAETDVARVTALLAVSFLADTLFDGLVSKADPVDMDAVDYTGQRPADVLNDCAQQSGKNYFVFYDEAGTYTPAPGDFALWYGSNDLTVYLSSLRVSNVLTDVDNAVTWAPLEDAVLTRDPSRVVSGVFIQNGSDSVYRTQPITSYKYGWRDAVTSSPNLHTIAQMQARADRYLAENSTEDDRLVLTVRVPAAHVNDWREGQGAQVRMSHMPGYESFRYVRALTRTVMQDEETDALYKIRYECTPMKPQPTGAYSSQRVGNAYSGQPTLPKPTAAGDVLIMALMGGGNTTVFPTDVRMLNNPSVFPATPEVPPFVDHAGWTVLKIATTDYSGQNIGGPCGVPYQGPFHGAAGACTAGLIAAIAWRRVLAGEESTTPVAVSTNANNATLAAWLWNVGNVPDLPGTAVEADGEGATDSVTATQPTLAGNILSAIVFATSAGHSAVIQPVSVGANANSAIVQANAMSSNQDLPAPSNADDWGLVLQRDSGGIVAGLMSVVPAYAALNWAGVTAALPSSVTLPTIPYPANQVG